MHKISFTKAIGEVGNLIRKTKIIPDIINVPASIPSGRSCESLRVIAGKFKDIEGPEKNHNVEPIYFHIVLKNEKEFSCEVPEGHNSFIYLLKGELKIGENFISSSTADNYPRVGDILNIEDIKVASSGIYNLIRKFIGQVKSVTKNSNAETIVVEVDEILTAPLLLILEVPIVDFPLIACLIHSIEKFVCLL